jgi:hypothetical protein
MKYTYTEHARTAAAERGISDELVGLCVDEPDLVIRPADGTTHYCRRFHDVDGRWLRVTMNEEGT